MKKILGLLITILFISAQYGLALAVPECEDPSIYRWNPKTQTCVKDDGSSLIQVDTLSIVQPHNGKFLPIMIDTDLLQIALGFLTPPWQVSSSDFDPQQKRLDIKIDFPRGSTFSCPECGQEKVKVYDTEEKTWRHLNFFQHATYLTAKVPRVQCDKCGIRLIDVPWARSGSVFTLLFEAERSER